MRYSILVSNRSGAVRYYLQRWSWSLRRFGRDFGGQFLRDTGSTVSFETLEQAEAYLEHWYGHKRREKQIRFEERLRWYPNKNMP